MDLYALKEAEGLVDVAYLHDSEGWDWSTIEVYYKPAARRFYWLDEGGCSCSYFGDGSYTLGDLRDGDAQAAIEALKAFHGPDNVTDRETAKVRDFTHEDGLAALEARLQEA